MLSMIFQSYDAILILAIMETVKRQVMVLSAIVQQDILVIFVIKVCSPAVYFHKIDKYHYSNVMSQINSRLLSLA